MVYFPANPNPSNRLILGYHFQVTFKLEQENILFRYISRLKIQSARSTTELARSQQGLAIFKVSNLTDNLLRHNQPEK